MASTRGQNKSTSLTRLKFGQYPNTGMNYTIVNFSCDSGALSDEATYLLDCPRIQGSPEDFCKLTFCTLQFSSRTVLEYWPSHYQNLTESLSAHEEFLSTINTIGGMGAKMPNLVSTCGMMKGSWLAFKLLISFLPSLLVIIKSPWIFWWSTFTHWLRLSHCIKTVLIYQSFFKVLCELCWVWNVLP